MRITLSNLAGMRNVTVRKWNKVWACRGKYYDFPPKTPQALIDKGVKVFSVAELTERRLERWEPPVPDDPRFVMEIPPDQQLDWKTEPAFTHHDNVRLFEGVKQACMIAKAQHFESFPPAVENLIGRVETPHRDLLLQRAIMQSQYWNTDNDKLPKRFDSRKPLWRYKRKFGITRVKSSLILLRNLLRISQNNVSQFPSLMGRKQITDLPVYTYVMYKDKPIVMKETLDMVLTSGQMLPPFGDEEMMDSSVKYELPDMWPIYPTVDFLETNNYELSNETGFRSVNSPFSCPHTIVQVPRKVHWEQKHYQAAQIMTCLMYTAALARRKFGENVGVLPEPISVQHLSIDEGRLLFSFFQLNTLDLSSDVGVKNFVWTGRPDESQHLFHKVIGQPWMPQALKRDKLESFEPAAFENFLAVYLNGVPEVFTSSELSKSHESLSSS